MISDDLLALLTAAVDRELTPVEAVRLRRLLTRSPEARELHTRLEADRVRLRRLPVAQPPADFVARVMGSLPIAVPATRTPPTHRPTPVVASERVERSARTRSWTSVALAAALLLAVGSSGYLFLHRSAGPGVVQPGNQLAQGETNRRQPGRTPEPTWAEILPKDHAQLPSVPPAEHVPSVVASRPTPAEHDQTLDTLPAPRPVEPRDVLGFRVLPPIPPLDLIQIRIPFLASFADLDRADVRQKLTDELGRDPALRIDLFATDLHRGIELVQTAASGAGVSVVVDAATQERLKRKQAAAYLIYVECLTPTELRDLLTKLADLDAKAPARALDVLHLTPVQSLDFKELKELLGVDLGFGKPIGHGHTSPGLNETKPLSMGTADQLAKTLTSPVAKAPEKPALMMTLLPPHLRTPPMASKELRQFLDRRRDRKPTDMPVVIVIRQSGPN